MELSDKNFLRLINHVYENYRDVQLIKQNNNIGEDVQHLVINDVLKEDMVLLGQLFRIEPNLLNNIFWGVYILPEKMKINSRLKLILAKLKYYAKED